MDAAGLAEAEGGRVLPRPLRRLVRFAVGLAVGRVSIPRHAGSVAAASFFATFAIGARAWSAPQCGQRAAAPLIGRLQLSQGTRSLTLEL